MPGNTGTPATTLTDSDNSNKEKSLHQPQPLGQSPHSKRRPTNNLSQEHHPGRQSNQQGPLPSEQGKDLERQLSQKQESLAVSTEDLSTPQVKVNVAIHNPQDDGKSIADLAAEVTSLRETNRSLEAQLEAAARRAIAAEATAETNKQTADKLEIGLSGAHAEIASLKAEHDKALQTIRGSSLQRLLVPDETMEARLIVISQEVVAMQSQLLAKGALIRRQKGLIEELRQQKDRLTEQLAAANGNVAELTRIVEAFWS
ncbi:hypothetical protein MFIFM68171_06776 [Madurella fahalii]|uniref:Uncharacterized protein n=1 Tax=Madurella fahalii TaxID=1157608 RepID=A0ABQ0GFM9_9PEZI